MRHDRPPPEEHAPSYAALERLEEPPPRPEHRGGFAIDTSGIETLFRSLRDLFSSPTPLIGEPVRALREASGRAVVGTLLDVALVREADTGALVHVRAGSITRRGAPPRASVVEDEQVLPEPLEEDLRLPRVESGDTIAHLVSGVRLDGVCVAAAWADERRGAVGVPRATYRDGSPVLDQDGSVPIEEHRGRVELLGPTDEERRAYLALLGPDAAA